MMTTDALRPRYRVVRSEDGCAWSVVDAVTGRIAVLNGEPLDGLKNAIAVDVAVSLNEIMRTRPVLLH